ncbi:MAG: XTP/dITP diphosphatase [Clostridia bacterium]|nr:XTP/dITP diphosphatase [Oscillospiraceae bacterium]MDY5627594.1 XTP/dITP diphosphatase [Clostridia bacterium]
MRLILATSNKGKLKEVKEILPEYDIVTMGEMGINEDIEENGTTFEENAYIKAKFIADRLNAVTIADDSGLEVDYLDGAPGIYSARFAGEGASDKDRNEKLLSLLKDVPFEKRTARYVCAIAIVFPDGEKHIFKQTCEGYILDEEVGNGGFGYDPLFYFPEFKTTLANVPLDVKNTVSHRSKALEELKKFLAERKSKEA